MHALSRIARVAILLALLATLLALGAPASAAPSAAPGVVANANWILGAVMPDGAIEIYPDSPPTTIEPYFANYAAMGLARAAALTGNARYSAAAWNWLGWYSAHEGPNGVVTDYTIRSGTEVSTGTEDSTDSYAGTFLSALAMASPTNPSRVATLAAGIHGAVRAILATQDRDGLTYATPSYPVKYLMDNAETYDGLVAAARMEKALGDRYWATVATNAAGAMENGIQTLWNRNAGDFNWAKFADGSLQATNWSVMYPDALEQASAVAFQVAGAHTAALMAAFNAHQASWAATAAVGYEPLVAIGEETVSATTAGLNGAAANERFATASAHAWPFNVSTAGELIFADSNSPLVVM